MQPEAGAEPSGHNPTPEAVGTRCCCCQCAGRLPQHPYHDCSTDLCAVYCSLHLAVRGVLYGLHHVEVAARHVVHAAVAVVVAEAASAKPEAVAQGSLQQLLAVVVVLLLPPAHLAQALHTYLWQWQHGHAADAAMQAGHLPCLTSALVHCNVLLALKPRAATV